VAPVKQQPAVRYDGLYQSEKKDNAWYYLRFYKDGTVLSVTSIGTPAQVARWFNKQFQGEGMGKGTYSIDGDQDLLLCRRINRFLLVEVDLGMLGRPRDEVLQTVDRWSKAEDFQ